MLEQWCGYGQHVVPVELIAHSKGVSKHICKACAVKQRQEYDTKEDLARRTRKHNEARRSRAEELLANIMLNEELTFTPLTEAQWLQACSYFNGCAICGESHIETREFLLGFQNGGKYAAWNIIPLCGKCALHSKQVKNPFVWLDSRLGATSKQLGLNDERRERLIEYLHDKVGEAIGKQ